MRNPRWVEYNGNPFGLIINDCAIRAVKAGLGIKYREVCRFFRKKYRPGRGLDEKEGIGLVQIQKKFGPFLDVIENSWDTWYGNRPEEFKDMPFEPGIDDDMSMGLDLNEFCDLYDGTGRYFVALVEDTDADDPIGHIVYANLSRKGRPLFYDVMDCGSFKVLSFMRIKTRWPKSNPKSLYYIAPRKLPGLQPG